jgi:hypothetical protein
MGLLEPIAYISLQRTDVVRNSLSLRPPMITIEEQEVGDGMEVFNDIK